ncbi:MAG TPA: serine/threonine-protein kinase [Vicinamibacterales bacterium]
MSVSGGRVKELFLAALDRDAAERRAFLADACAGDQALLENVESLLTAHDEIEDNDGATAAPASDKPFASGDVFAGRYRMVARLGQGGMGDVWRADDLILDMPVALKLLHAAGPVGRALLLNEVRLARRVTHPSVCRVFDVGEERGQIFLSMELVEGEDLSALLQHTGRLPSDRVAEIGRQLCDALAAAHAQGILHRDLKPANILIDTNGGVHVTDFGIAAKQGASGPKTGVGTPGYMAPEQLASGAPVSERTDIYAMGLVLYQLLVGRHPVDQTGRQQPRPSTLVSAVDPAVEHAIMQALSPNPADRPASALEMKRLLTGASDKETPPRRLWWFVAAGVAAVLAIVAVLRFTVPTKPRALTEQDTILLTDFVNTTGEPVFDGALKVALAVALEQSPFLKVFPDDRMRDALRMMNRPPDERITRSVGRELAQRERLKALVAGSIASLGRNYVIAIEAIASASGDVMAREQVEVTEKEQVLSSLGHAAARLRQRLGESLASVQKFDVPLPRATTSSLEALHSYALALDQDRLVARAGAIPHLKRAIELDPEFALAQALLSGVYANSNQSVLAPEFARRAFELRDRVSERERFFITWRYYHDATQDWDRMLELARTWTATYPREPFAFNSLAAVHKTFGQYEQAIEPLRYAMQLDSSFDAPVENLAFVLLMLNRFDEAKDTIRRAAALRPDLLSLRRFGYLIAWIEGDVAAMARELAAAQQLPDATAAADLEPRTMAFAGRLRAAHDAFRRAVAAATHAELVEPAALWSAIDGEAHALTGQCADARRDAAAALELSRDNFTLERANRTYAICGARAEAGKLATELTERFPQATLTHRVQLPVAAAALALDAGEPLQALRLLEPVRAYDRARGAEFWPEYIRAQAYLMAKKPVEARREFDAILARRGEASDSLLFPLARLGVARAAALARDTAAARDAYDGFLLMWRDADGDLPPIREARAERARLP